MPLTGRESGLLGALGQILLYSVTRTTLAFFAYGVFVSLFWKVVTSVVRRKSPSKSAWIIFCTTIFNFLAYSLYVWNQLSAFIVLIRKSLVDTFEISDLINRQTVTNNALRPNNLVSYWSSNMIVLMGDFIVLWRAWVLLQDKRWVVILPSVLWLGTLGTLLAQLILRTLPYRFDGYSGIDRPVDYLFVATPTLSLATNVTTTLLIAYRLWTHRIMLVNHLGLSGRTSPAQKILVLLVESGLVYCVFQATYLAILFRSSDAKGYALFVFSEVYYALSAMYPTIVVAFVESQRSMTDMIVTPTVPSLKRDANGLGTPLDARDATFGHLSFARPGQTTTNEDAYTQNICVLDRETGLGDSHEKGIDLTPNLSRD